MYSRAVGMAEEASLSVQVCFCRVFTFRITVQSPQSCQARPAMEPNLILDLNNYGLMYLRRSVSYNLQVGFDPAVDSSQSSMGTKDPPSPLRNNIVISRVWRLCAIRRPCIRLNKIRRPNASGSTLKDTEASLRRLCSGGTLTMVRSQLAYRSAFTHPAGIAGELRLLFAHGDMYDAYMDVFFAENHFPSVSWLHDLDKGRYGPASHVLLGESGKASSLETKHVSTPSQLNQESDVVKRRNDSSCSASANWLIWHNYMKARPLRMNMF